MRMNTINFNAGNGTFGELLHPAMEITTVDNMRDYLKDYARYLSKQRKKSFVEAYIEAKKNVLYWTEYQNESKRKNLLIILGEI